MASEPLQFQREYQQEKMPFKPGHVRSKVIMLGLLILFGFIGNWWVFPTNTLANLPYCAKNLFASNATENKLSETTLDGVYISQQESYRRYYGILRFYNDSQVIFTEVSAYQIEASWRKISFWFNRESKQAKYMHGNYEIIEDQIKFTTYNSPEAYSVLTEINWAGRFSEKTLDLIWVRQLTKGYQTGSDTFTRFHVEQCPFTK